jgi:hypothetical protein
MEASVAGDAQLTWERRFAPWAAGAALIAIGLQVAGILIGAPANKDSPGRNDPLPIQQSLENFHHHANALLASQLCQAVSSVFAAVVLFYLFRATRARRKELPAAVQWVLVIGPILFLIAVVVSWSDSKSASDKYTAGGAATQVSVKTTKDQRKDAREFCKKHPQPNCVASRAHNEAVAKKISDDNRSPKGAAAGFGGVLALGFGYIIIALNAMRAGLLSRFTGILGVIVGALTVLPLLPGPVVQIFWLGSLSVLFLGRWPGVGRGPAWETGRAEPWPVPERRGGGGGGLFGPRGPAAEPDPEPPPEPDPEPVNRPASRKRRRKKKR